MVCPRQDSNLRPTALFINLKPSLKEVLTVKNLSPLHLEGSRSIQAELQGLKLCQLKAEAKPIIIIQKTI